ncbi:MAG: CSLREA domain-containing protein, partial [Abitibacteriaceae bacterium]|nr:CSLREA domain-containing protein [Abditibacteriaceae bacterium]
IGTAANGTSPLGNTANGISFVFSNNNVVGGSPGGGPPNAGNIIAFNAASGITTATGSGGAGNSFLGNSIFSNGGLGIDLDNNGVTPNDTGDADTGSNNLQNYPVIARAITAGSTTTVVGSLNSLAKTTFTLEFFANPVADPSGFGEGQTYLDTRAVTTDAAGNANFSFTLPLSVAVGQFITATATNNATGDTSEFAQDVAVTTGTAFVVNSTADTADANPGDGACDVDPATPGSQCTLRAAIQESNALPGLDTINFNIPGGGVQTITPASALPVITQPVIIDGFSQPGSTSNTLSGGSNATMLIELNGTSAGGSVDGLRLTGGGSTVRGLVINHFSGNAITLDTTGGNVVEGCYIGTNPTGTTLAGNGNDGIFINGIANNIVGGLNPAQRMVVAGNSNFGVAFENGGGNNQLLGTYVGLNAAGTAALGNVAGGVNVTSSNNSIGGLSAGARNLISGNGETGLFITGAGVTGNVVQGNYIGTDITGTFDLGNVVDGIVIDLGAGGSTIGGTQPGAGNLISGNNFGGVDVAGPNNTVQGNLIGTDVTGNVALPNSAIGLFIQFASGNLIGGNTSGARNVISGNSGAGVVLSNNATGNTVAGNFIGVGLDGSTPVANTGDGVQFFNATSNNVIGGPTAADGNIIANNGQDGVTIAAGTGEAILSNSIFSNGGNATNAPGIDLGNDGVTPNDAGDVDTGPNNLQNFPVLTSAVASGSTTTVTGTLNSTANTAFTVQFFSNRNADPSGHGEGQTLLATRTVTTNGSGNAAFSLALPGTVPFGQFITATATDPGNNTSEFSNDLAVDTPGSIQFSANAYSVAENVNGGNTTITVTRSGGSAGSVTVPIVVTPGTATNGTDYSVPTSGQPAGVAVTTGTPAGGDTVTLTFGPGEVSKSFLVNVIDDTLNEPNETVNFTLGTPGGGAITGAQTTATLTIVDNDPAPTLSINNVTTPEGNVGTTNATFTVTLSAASGKTVTVDYATAPGTATANVDYQSRSGTLTFNPGETTKNIVVPIIGDTLNEGDETYSVTLSNVANGVLNNATGVGTIADDDAAPSLAVNDVTVAEGNSGPTNAVFTVSLSAASGQTVTVDYATADGTATAGSDYQSRSGTLTFAPGETSKTVAVIVNGDTLNEPDETFTLVLSDPTHATIADNQGVGTITNDDSPPSLSINDVSVPEGDSGTTPATFTVSLSAASGQTVTVKYATADGTATAPADYAAASGTLTFAAGETAKTVTVAVQGDTLNEANETFTVLLSGATNATIARTTGIGTILDDDAAAFKLSISPNTFSEGAGANAATGTVTRNTATTTAQVVNLASSNTNKATVPATVTIPVGATFATFSINAVDNTLADGPTVVTITAGRTGFTGDAAQVTVVDNDGPTLTLTISPNTFSEGAGANAAVGTVTRNTSTSAPLVVSLANSDATKVTVPATVTIPAGAASVTFPVGAVDNSVVDGNKTVTLTATSSGLNAGVASVTVTDNDVTPTPTPAPTPTPTPTPDTTAPTVTIDVPRNGDIVSSLTAVIGTATDASGISRVDLLIQSPAGYWTGSGWAAGLFPLTTTLNGTTWTRGTGLPAGDNLVNGTYTLQAIAYDKAGNAGSTSITITVDKTAPTLTFTLPNNTFVSNLSVVAGQVVDNRNGSGVARVELLIQRASDRRYWNGTTFVTTPTVLNTTLAGNTWSRRTGLPAGPGVLTEGRYYLLARAYDQAGLVTRAQISVIVDTTPPTATFTAPLDKATLKHLGPITGTASDNRGGSGLLSVGLTIQRRSDRRYW